MPLPSDLWRAEHRLIDLHQHVNSTTQHIARGVRIMDAAGIGVAANLSGGTVTAAAGKLSAFERMQRLSDALAPGRFVLYFNLDYTGWGEADWSARAVKQVEDAHRLGAAGLKKYKRLGSSCATRTTDSSAWTTRSSTRCGSVAASWACP